MLRSVSIFSGNRRNPTHSVPPAKTRLRLGRLLLLAALEALIASVPSASGQSESSSGASQSASPQTENCVPEKDNAKRALTLAIAKTQPSNDEIGATEQRPTPKNGLQLTSKDIDLPDAEASNSANQVQAPLCKKVNSPAEPGRPDDGLPPASQADDSKEAPKVPTVTYVDGELSVNAQNVPLGDVIEAIRDRTGIAVEFPSETMDGRVFDQVGPAPLRDVLSQLLYGSGFNYIIQTSSQDPQTVTKLVLSSQLRVASAEPPQHANQPDKDALPGEAVSNNEVPVQPAQPIPVQSALQQGIPVGVNIQQAAAASGKTTGQILDELQKRQQQILDAQAPPQ